MENHVDAKQKCYFFYSTQCHCSLCGINFEINLSALFVALLRGERWCSLHALLHTSDGWIELWANEFNSNI